MFVHGVSALGETLHATSVQCFALWKIKYRRHDLLVAVETHGRVSLRTWIKSNACVTYLVNFYTLGEKIKQIRALPLKGPLPYPLHPQLRLWFTYYKGTFSTFVFASQNRAFMLRSVLRTLRPSRQLTHPLPLYVILSQICHALKSKP